MGLSRDHDLLKRRARSNLWLGLVLGGFVILVFGVTVVKMSNGAAMEAFDHSLRPSLTEPAE